jgi:hypothetical protein
MVTTLRLSSPALPLAVTRAICVLASAPAIPTTCPFTLTWIGAAPNTCTRP